MENLSPEDFKKMMDGDFKKIEKTRGKLEELIKRMKTDDSTAVLKSLPSFIDTIKNVALEKSENQKPEAPWTTKEVYPTTYETREEAEQTLEKMVASECMRFCPLIGNNCRLDCVCFYTGLISETTVDGEEQTNPELVLPDHSKKEVISFCVSLPGCTYL